MTGTGIGIVVVTKPAGLRRLMACKQGTTLVVLGTIGFGSALVTRCSLSRYLRGLPAKGKPIVRIPGISSPPP